ncbi:MAG: glycosyltransferase family 2 protein [Candidatus Euphemobacter frigidus]|nr:glycosyltransferase family 2 protein [Candidatus Euphemobacter frigidus]MDP8276397.1 glycosyltransferase family 2 protein [Candidatus Euphemobacter frigidus]
MKLIVQIPCLNEEETVGETIRDIPREIPSIDRVEVLVIDDGSTDRTREVATAAGADHIISFTNRKGLARAFSAGIDTALKLGADIIVNTDADNQYRGADIPKLIAPILKKEADIVVGDREVEKIKHFSPVKKYFQRLGSWAVRKLSNTSVPDAASGFRAYNRDAAFSLNVVSDFSYTLETLIQAGKGSFAVGHVPIRTNPQTRPSRLFTGMYSYIKRSVITLIRIYTMYEPLKVFTMIGSLGIFLGVIISARFLYFLIIAEGRGHVQSLIFAAIFFIVGFQILVIGLLADTIAANRKLTENVLYRVKKLESRRENEQDPSSPSSDV